MKEKLVIIQDNLKDCGISSLLSIIRYYGGDADREYLREITNTNQDGVSAYSLMMAARDLGFDSFGIHGELIDIKKSELPLIAHLEINKSYNHFVVIYKINFYRQKILIMDPSNGFRELTFSEWNDISTNNYLVLKPKKVIPKLVDNYSISSLINLLLKTYRKSFLVIIILSIIYTIINVIISYSFSLLFTDFNYIKIKDIKVILFVLIGLIFIKKLANYFRNNLINYLNHTLSKKMYNDIFSHIINLPYLYYKSRTTGDILTRINDLGKIRDLIGNLFITVIIDMFLISIVSIFLLIINKELTFISISIMLLYLLVMLFFNKRIYRSIKSIQKDAEVVNSNIIESIQMVDTVKGLSLQNMIIDKFQEKYNKFSIDDEKLSYLNNKEYFWKNLILQVGNLLILYIGVIKIKKGLISISMLIAFTSLLSYFLEPIKNIVDLNYLYKEAKESIRRVRELYKISCEKVEYQKCYQLPSFKGDISIKNLSYSYNGVNNILENINLEIKSGEKVLVYGSSGSGKSTLIKILVRYLDNYQGIIKIDDNNLESINTFNLREKTVYVSQKENLFTDSIYNNIVLNQKVEYKDFLEISKMCFVDEIITKNKINYDYLLEENGFNLSGGERQRIVLARTIIRNYDIYIFDEALNAIDIKTERKILKNIFMKYKDKTIIVVSHRFNNGDLFDKKILVKDGKYAC